MVSVQVRLQLCLLVLAIVERAARIGAEALLSAYLQDFILGAYVRAAYRHWQRPMLMCHGMWIQVFIVDPYPDLRIAGCRLVVHLCGRMPDILKHFAVAYVRALKTGLDHRHAKVRPCALDTHAPSHTRMHTIRHTHTRTCSLQCKLWHVRSITLTPTLASGPTPSFAV